MQARETFSGRFAILIAAAGSAVGLGNIWRFPYLAGQNGGAAFIIIYLICVFLLGIPLMMSEFAIGRKAGRNAIGSFRSLSPGSYWYLVGFIGIVASFVILSFYSVVAGWTFEYIYQLAVNAFQNQSPQQISNYFDMFVTGNLRPVLWQVLVMILTALIIYSGVKNGIEKFSKIFMPLLLLIIIILDARALFLDGSGEGYRFLFTPDFSKITGTTIITALGQAFFSLSLGMGALITYGSYVKKDVNLGMTAIGVSIIDTIVAICAGLAIIPAVFAFGLQPGEGPGLVFKTLPVVFQQMGGGSLFGTLFFILLAIAAITSTISLLEVVVAYMTEEFSISRKWATFSSGLAITLLGVFCSLSNGILSQYKILGLTLMGLCEYLSSNILLPAGGLCIVLFLGWFYPMQLVKDELSNQNTLRIRWFGLYHFILRYFTPVAIILVFLNGFGFFYWL